MIKLELSELISKLTPELKQDLESAAGDCLSRQHFTVTVEHWLFQQLKRGSSIWIEVLESVSIEPFLLINELEMALSTMAKGNDSPPSISSELVELIKDAWLIASINQMSSKITPYHIIMVGINRLSMGSIFCYGCQSVEDLMKKVSLSWIQSKAEFTNETIKGGQREDSHTSFDAHTALDKYCKNITQQANEGELDSVIGRHDEIRKAIDILCRRKQNNPILVGEPGVGKTAIVEGLACRIVEKTVPSVLLNTVIYSLDLALLQAGASIKGEFENRLKDILNEVKASTEKIIIFIDEAHSLIGAGGKEGQGDAANILKPALARGDFKTLAATTWAEYKKYFEKDAALTRRFQLISVNEPTEEVSIQILRGTSVSLSEHHQVRISDKALEAAVSLSVRYLPDRQLPDKAISLLDTACARIALSQVAEPHQIESEKVHLSQLQTELIALEGEVALGNDHQNRIQQIEKEIKYSNNELTTLNTRWQEEKKLTDELLALELKVLNGDKGGQFVDELSKQRQTLSQIQGDHPLVHSIVDDIAIATVIALWTGIPVGNMLEDEVDRLVNLEKNIAKRVVGQSGPIKSIADSIRISRTGLGDIRKPMGVFLMCGPSGVGKTETALALSEQLFGGEQYLTTLNMTEFKEEHKVSMLLGAPAGYVGYGQGGVLTEAVRKKPYGVLLLDEMEKAHSGVHDIFYQIFDKGCINDSEGRNISFKNILIIMTSNAADKLISELCSTHSISIDKLAVEINDEMQRYFKPAFLGRCTLVPYYPLTESELSQIAKLVIARIAERIKAHYSAKLECTQQAYDYLLGLNQSPETGARAIEQIVQMKILPKLSTACIEKLVGGEKFKLVKIDYNEVLNISLH
ncbi:type VI secretion system ATPase TssH [uncultured Shewanella sp.]|uniref:type VI secretion system ATPase TssH n=1 Tax=uncultured Shewanella sp. TaxID=173975 RepID=UPI0026399886|nr:type VI secretion system ATPase TssH [uncultured Shewanella sp.]